MKKRIVLLFISIILFYPFQLLEGQQTHIYGKVFEQETNIPLEYASVVLQRNNDSVIINGCLVAADGTFSFQNIYNGSYFIKVQFMGYNNAFKHGIIITDTKKSIDIGNIYLNKNAILLNEIQVVGEKRKLEYKIDRKVLNVDKELAASGGSAVDAIKNIPSVETSIDGSIKVRGSSNFTLLIDGKPTLLDASDLLAQIPASTIEKIEIITNPSAKYDPDGTSGIINVKMKKNSITGFSGIANLTGGTGPQYTGDAVINYNSNKISVSGGIEYVKQNMVNTEISDRMSTVSDTATFLSINEIGNRYNDKKSLKFSINYSLFKYNTISFSGNYNLLSIGHTSANKSYQWTNENLNGNYFLSEDKFKINPKILELNYGVEHLFDSLGNSKISLNVFNVNGSVISNEDLNMYYSETSYLNKLGIKDINSRRTSEDVNLYDLDLDYEKNFGSGALLEAGYQMKLFQTSNNYDVYTYDKIISDIKLDSLQSNSVEFKRQIHALYSTFAKNFNKFSVKAGVRVEYTNQLLEQNKEGVDYAYKKLDFYPSIYISRSLPNNQQIQLSYSRRTDRPQVQFLNPYTFFSDGFTSVKGNPDLKPDKTNSFELNYQKRFGGSNISIEPYFRQTINKISRVQEIDQSGLLIRTMKNLSNEYSLGVELMGNFRLVKWFELIPRANWFKYRLEGNYNSIDLVKNSENWRAGLTMNLIIKSNTSLQFVTNYDSPTVTIDGKMFGIYYVGMSIKQNFLNKKASLSLRVEDIFNSRHMTFKSSSNGFYQNSEMFISAPQIFLSFSYKFNNYERKNKGEKESYNNYNIY